MSEFAEFEPSAWQEDGMLVGRRFRVFKTVGLRAAALFAAVAISLASLAGVRELSVSVPARAVATSESPPIAAHPYESGVRAERDDRDVVPPGYWLAADLALRALPALPAEPPDSDDEPFI